MTWTIEPHGKGYALYSGRDKGDEYGCFATHGMNLVYLSEPDANWERTKAMIEAAPDLLKACELVEKWWLDEGMKTFDGAPAAVFAVRAAIAKARGEQ